MSSSGKTVIDDIVVLGNAVPDEISDNRFTVCTAGFSKKYGLIRIYPVPPNAPMERWNVVEIPVERNSKDTREESWKIQGSRDEWVNLHKKIKVHKTIDKREDKIALVKSLHENFGVSCVQDLNNQKLSLGMIKPKILGHRFEERPRYDPSVQMTLDSVQQFLTINNYKEQPRITYRCADCKSKNPHDQQLIEWGAYEWMRKFPDKKEKLWENLRLDDPEWDISFLVGNQSIHRNSFMIISVFRNKMSMK